AVASAFAVATASAQEPKGTLDRIRESGTISLGHRESSVPFAYYDDKQQVVGYSYELMLRVVEAVKRELGVAERKVKLPALTSQNRLPRLQHGTISLECVSPTNSLDRQKQVAFSTPLFVIGPRLPPRKDWGIKDFSDLAGKNVVTTAGTTSERLIRKMNE